jgi:hypothetical protein
VVAGCEAHVRVLQTVLGLIEPDSGSMLVRDAIGVRRAESKENRNPCVAHQGANTVTTEIVMVEWLGRAGHPRLREVLALIRQSRNYL